MNNLIFRYYPQPISDEDILLEKKIFKYSMVIPMLFIITFWLIKIIEITLDIHFIELGNYPRHLKGLTGILTSPLIHSNFAHLIGNSTSFLILATTLFFFYRRVAIKVFILNYLISGFLLWLIGREAWHIGASGVIYGLTTFLLLSGIIRHDLRLLTISLIVTFLYGGFIWGIFPIDPEISWDGHLSGAISGIFLAIVFHKYGPPQQKYDWEEESELDVESDENEAYIENNKPDKSQ